MSTTVWRFRLATVCLLLVTFAFLQSPGEIAADTKLDLTVAPVEFLRRAMTLWEPLGFFGQVQNQAYGYLFPMGPFFAAGDLLDLPEWVVQRLWWSLLLCVAFLGVVRLVRLLLPAAGVGAQPATLSAVLAGLAYALAPRMLSTLGPVSAEVIPMALAPWVLVPLVLASRGRSPRVMAARSGVAVLAMGAVNAVATVAVLALAVWWLATRRPLQPTLSAWWSAAVGLACLWWAIPLLLLGRYSPPFLDWIESAAITTRPNEPATLLRGASHWVPYVSDPSGPVWPAGWSLVAEPLLVMALGVVATLGLLGLARPDLPERAFLVGASAIGVAMLSFGHVGAAAATNGFLASTFQDLLDGPLAPLRNVHKGDPVLRLALVVALAHLLRTVRAGHRPQWVRTGVAAAASVAVLVAGLPFWSGQLTAERTYAEVPGYWDEVAADLASRGTGRALVVPGAGFAEYVWGRTQDEPLQPIATTPWAVRDAVPLSSAGNIRLLDAVDEILASGRGSGALAPLLTRMGVTELVVRNDLAAAVEPPRPALIRQALDRSPGLRLDELYGPVLPPFRTEELVVDDGLQPAVAALEVWSVEAEDGEPRVELRRADELMMVHGGPESVIPLLEAGALASRPLVIAGDEASGAAAGLSPDQVVTDTYRRSEFRFGAIRDNRSPTMTDQDAYVQDRPVHDYFPVVPTDRQAVATWATGVATASSSSSEVDGGTRQVPATQPWSALDGDPATAWMSTPVASGESVVGSWWQLDLAEARGVDELSIVLPAQGRVTTAETSLLEEGGPLGVVRVTTDAGSRSTPLRFTQTPQAVGVVPGSTRTIRVTLESLAADVAPTIFGLAEVLVQGPAVTRPVRTAGETADGPIVLRARTGERAGCLEVERRVQCSGSLPVSGEERAGLDRLVTTSDSADFTVRALVRPRPGAALDALLAPRRGAAQVSTSSQLVADPRSGPLALTDGVPGTAWTADALDRTPTITVRLPERRAITGVELATLPALAASRPLEVTVRAGGQTRQGFVDRRGRLRFPTVDTDRLTIELGAVSPLRSRSPLLQGTTTLPVGVSELWVFGAQDLISQARSERFVEVPCGEGPRVRVLSGGGETVLDTAVATSAAAVLAGSVLVAEPCLFEPVTLPAGEHRIVAGASAEFLFEQVALLPDERPRGRLRQPVVQAWSPTSRTLEIPESQVARILETTENANAGWQARLAGEPLQRLRVDGWRQAFLLPVGASGTVELTYAPQVPYRVGLVVGALAAAALILLAVWPARTATRLPTRGPSRHAKAPVGLTSVVVAGAALVAGGPSGVVAVLVALAVGRWWPRSVPVVVGSAGLLSAALAAMWPWPQSQDLPVPLQVLVSTAALLAWSVAALAPWRSRGR